MFPKLLALYELQDFLSQKWHLCVLQPVMDTSSADLSNPFWSHAFFCQTCYSMPLFVLPPLCISWFIGLYSLLPCVSLSLLRIPSLRSQSSSGSYFITLSTLSPFSSSALSFFRCRGQHCMQPSRYVHLTDLWSAILMVSTLFSIPLLIIPAVNSRVNPRCISLHLPTLNYTCHFIIQSAP